MESLWVLAVIILSLSSEIGGSNDKCTVLSASKCSVSCAGGKRQITRSCIKMFTEKCNTYSCICQNALGMESGAISNKQISASSERNVYQLARQGRLNFKENTVLSGAWAAKANDHLSWLQIDLIKTKNVTRVATQGRNYNPKYSWRYHRQWVTKYKLQYGDNPGRFKYYRERGQTKEKVFDGNTDRDSVIYHNLDPPITARYIRFLPTAWNGNSVAMRVELYGC